MDIFFDLLPMILGTALAPAWVIIVLLILRNQNGLVKAIAFVIGTTVVRLLQGVIFGYLLRNAKGIEEANGSSPVVSVLLAVLGILLLISAVKKLINEEDPDAPPPKWISTFEQATPLALLAAGAVSTLIAPKLWVFTLSTIGIILGADLNPWDTFKTYFLYTLAAQTLLILPLLLCAIAPHQSARILQSISDWLTQNKKPITLLVSLVFGSYFLWKGLSGLLA
ncbi:MAG: hypothetical protein C4288_10465 [Leptolyngbya sp. ERB_1_1]